MIKRKTLKDGRFVVVTTRRANYVSYIFGKATIYASKKAYDTGTLREGWTEVTNIPLGQKSSELEAKVDEFINSLEPETPSRFNLALDEDPNLPFNDAGYTCSKCGCPITAAEGDDNSGMCEDCAGDS